VVVLISAVAGFVCLNVNVDTTNVGGITGTVIVQPDTPKEHVDQTCTALRIAGVGWICSGTLSLAWAVPSARR
jgi:hypothetical protein